MSALRGLSREYRLAGLAAAGLLACLGLPWFEASFAENGGVRTENRIALLHPGFIEAALAVVAVSVLGLLWARARRRGFHLPGGDGVAVSVAGGWAVVLCVWHMFDRPVLDGASMGLQWGIFAATIVAAGLFVSGQRLRAAHVAEPPNPAATDEYPTVRLPARVAALPPRRPGGPPAGGPGAGGPPSNVPPPPPPPPPSPPDPATRAG